MTGDGRHAFVSGATGFLGRHLTEQLAAAGWQVTALARRYASERRPAL